MYDLIQSSSAGCAQPNINGKQIENMPAPDVTFAAQMEFANVYKQVDMCKLTIQQGLDKMKVLKKTPMQKYIE